MRRVAAGVPSQTITTPGVLRITDADAATVVIDTQVARWRCSASREQRPVGHGVRAVAHRSSRDWGSRRQPESRCRGA